MGINNCLLGSCNRLIKIQHAVGQLYEYISGQVFIRSKVAYGKKLYATMQKVQNNLTQHSQTYSLFRRIVLTGRCPGNFSNQPTVIYLQKRQK